MNDLEEVKSKVNKNGEQIVNLRIQVTAIDDKTARHEKVIDRVSNLLLGAFMTALIGSIYFFIQNSGK